MWTKKLSKDDSTEKYLYWQQRRLAKLQSQGRSKEYWALALLLLKRSKAFRMVALRNVRPNWYDDWLKVVGWLKRLNENMH
jgi:hypothetical protein